MPDTSPSDPEELPQPLSITSVSGGVNLDAQRDVNIGGDVVGRDKITVGYTVEQVSSLLAQISSTFQPKPFDGRCPYLGLDAFSEDDADRFFGRETLTAELVGRVNESRFVVIAGPSGSGKSSLVRAGLIHTLKQGALPTSERWLYATLTPGRDPIESLALAMSRLARSPDAGKYLRDHSAEPNALHDFVESQLNDRKDQRAVIFVDQFEEVFTQVAKEDERLAFLNLLTHAATPENGRVTALVALRSDFVSNCATYPQLNALLNQQFIQVGAMQPSELVSAIARPALQVGLRIDPDLVAQIVNDMQDEPGALPLMQFALKDLFDVPPKGDVIALTLNDYLARGGLHKALERHADAAFAKLSESEQQLARTIFSGLIEIGRGTQDTRRTATFDELVPANINVTQVKAVVQKLADARLITTHERDSQNTVTISHERLIGAWPWLRKLISEHRESIALQNQIVEDAQDWNEHQRDSSYLYSGARLATAREQLAGQRIVLSELAQHFVAASIGAEESAHQREKVRQQQEIRRLRGRNRIITAVGTLALLAAIVAVFLGLRAEQQAQTAYYRQLAAQAIARLSDDFDLALLLSVETARLGSALGDSYEGRDTVLKALGSNPNLKGYFFGDFSPVASLALSPDGQRLALGSDHSITFWDVTERQELGEPLTGDFGRVESMAFSPDGKILATEGENVITLWDVTTRQRVGEPLTDSLGMISCIAFSPNGEILAAGGGESITLWDVATRQRLGRPFTGAPQSSTSREPTPDKQPVQIESLAFSSNGKTLATASPGRIDLWDVATHRHLSISAAGQPGTAVSVALGPDSQKWATGRENGDTNMLAFSQDGDTLAAGSDESIVFRDMLSHHRLAIDRDYVTPVKSAALSSDGQTAAFIASINTIILWDMATFQSLDRLFQGYEGTVESVAFSGDGKTLAWGSGDGRIALLDVATRQRLGEPLSGHSAAVNSVAFSPDGKILASGGEDESVILWDVATHQRLSEPLASHSGAVNNVVFSDDGKTLAWGSDDGGITLFDVAMRQRLGEPLSGHSARVNSVTFSPDGKMLASAGEDKRIILWDVATRQRRGELLAGRDSPVITVDFDPAGHTLAAGHFDGSIILWNVATRQQLGEPLIEHARAVRRVAFSPDGKTLFSGSAEGYIFVWDVDPKSWEDRACDIVGRNLTRQEWSRYFGERGEPYRKTCDQWPLEPEVTPAPQLTSTP